MTCKPASRLSVRRRQAGFSLMELAVVMAILTLLLGGMMLPLATQQDMRARQETERALADIREALLGFAIVNGRLPCPAAATTATGTPGAGNEARTGDNCACASATSGVAADGTVACDSAADNASVTGVLPWATLGMIETDAWSRRYTYRVATRFGRGAGQNSFGCNPSPAPSLAGFALCTPAHIMIHTDAGGATQLVSQGVPAIVVSHGKNGGGAYTQLGTQIPAASSGDEAENSDGDDIFVANSVSDDQLVWVPTHVLMNRMVAAGLLP